MVACLAGVAAEEAIWRGECGTDPVAVIALLNETATVVAIRRLWAS